MSAEPTPDDDPVTAAWRRKAEEFGVRMPYGPRPEGGVPSWYKNPWLRRPHPRLTLRARIGRILYWFLDDPEAAAPMEPLLATWACPKETVDPDALIFPPSRGGQRLMRRTR